MTTAYVTHPRYIEHHMPGHPEHAGRIQAVWKKLESTGLAARMKRIEPHPVTDEQILLVHSEEYLAMLNWMTGHHHTWFDADTYALPQTPEIARLAAGGVVAAVDAVLKQTTDNALAVVRPPGHHALEGRGMGFCILGNVPIAARHAQKAYGVERVMIVDFDVHHGNGTQDMFYGDDSILFISTHQSPFYPGTGFANEIGRDQGRGYTINIPMPAGHGDQSFGLLYQEIVWKAARRFRPQLILISAGFDAHWTDPLAMMRLSLEGYAHLTHELVRMAEELCDGHIVFALEGGYDLEALANGVANVAHALLGDDEIVDPLGKRAGDEPDVMPLIHHLQKLHNL